MSSTYSWPFPTTNMLNYYYSFLFFKDKLQHTIHIDLLHVAFFQSIYLGDLFVSVAEELSHFFFTAA